MNGYQLWFKAGYVKPILTGSKTRTARARKPLCRPGDEVVACVGPSRPFAILRILTCALTPLADIDPDYRAGVESLLGGVDPVWMITFELVAPIKTQSRARAATR